MPVDMTDPASITAFAAAAQAQCGAVDVLVNAAGWGRTAPFLEGTPEFWDKLVALNFVGPMHARQGLAAGDDGARQRAASSTSPATPGASAAWARRSTPAPRAA